MGFINKWFGIILTIIIVFSFDSLVAQGKYNVRFTIHITDGTTIRYAGFHSVAVSVNPDGRASVNFEPTITFNGKKYNCYDVKAHWSSRNLSIQSLRSENFKFSRATFFLRGNGGIIGLYYKLDGLKQTKLQLEEPKDADGKPKCFVGFSGSIHYLYRYIRYAEPFKWYKFSIKAYKGYELVRINHPSSVRVLFGKKNVNVNEYSGIVMVKDLSSATINLTPVFKQVPIVEPKKYSTVRISQSYGGTVQPNGVSMFEVGKWHSLNAVPGRDQEFSYWNKSRHISVRSKDKNTRASKSEKIEFKLVRRPLHYAWIEGYFKRKISTYSLTVKPGGEGFRFGKTGKYKVQQKGYFYARAYPLRGYKFLHFKVISGQARYMKNVDGEKVIESNYIYPLSDLSIEPVFKKNPSLTVIDGSNRKTILYSYNGNDVYASSRERQYINGSINIFYGWTVVEGNPIIHHNTHSPNEPRVTLNNGGTIKAEYIKPDYKLKLTAVGEGTVGPEPEIEVTPYRTYNISAQGSGEYQFVKWNNKSASAYSRQMVLIYNPFNQNSRIDIRPMLGVGDTIVTLEAIFSNKFNDINISTTLEAPIGRTKGIVSTPNKYFYDNLRYAEGLYNRVYIYSDNNSYDYTKGQYNYEFVKWEITGEYDRKREYNLVNLNQNRLALYGIKGDINAKAVYKKREPPKHVLKFNFTDYNNNSKVIEIEYQEK